MSDGLTLLTQLHTGISLVGIVSGLVVMWGLLRADPLPRWTAVFLITTVATSVTGYLFPFHQLMPSHVVGAISLVDLAVAIWARYGRAMLGGWSIAYVVSATVALYFNVIVLVAQLFAKVPALHALAPTQSEAPFAVAQSAVLVAFVALGVRAVRRTRAGTVAPRVAG